jgi:hypothetical protein
VIILVGKGNIVMLSKHLPIRGGADQRNRQYLYTEILGWIYKSGKLTKQTQSLFGMSWRAHPSPRS